jgi:hypothetical protein
VSKLNTTYLYLLVFAILVGGTDIEFNLATLQATIPYGYYVSILLGLAGLKAMLIAMFYQHLKYEPRSLSSWVIIGLVIASLLMSLSFIQLHAH